MKIRRKPLLWILLMIQHISIQIFFCVPRQVWGILPSIHSYVISNNLVNCFRNKRIDLLYTCIFLFLMAKLFYGSDRFSITNSSSRWFKHFKIVLSISNLAWLFVWHFRTIKKFCCNSINNTRMSVCTFQNGIISIPYTQLIFVIMISVKNLYNKHT